MGTIVTALSISGHTKLIVLENGTCILLVVEDAVQSRSGTFHQIHFGCKGEFKNVSGIQRPGRFIFD